MYVNNVFRQQQKSQQQQNTIIKILNRDGTWTRDLWTKDSGMPSLIDVIQYMYMNDFMSWIHYLESTFDVELRDSPHLRTAYRFIVSLRTAYGLIWSIAFCVRLTTKSTFLWNAPAQPFVFFARNDQLFSIINECAKKVLFSVCVLQISLLRTAYGLTPPWKLRTEKGVGGSHLC